MKSFKVNCDQSTHHMIENFSDHVVAERVTNNPRKTVKTTLKCAVQIFIHSVIFGNHYLGQSHHGSRAYPEVGIGPGWDSYQFQGTMYMLIHTEEQCSIANPPTACFLVVGRNQRTCLKYAKNCPDTNKSGILLWDNSTTHCAIVFFCLGFLAINIHIGQTLGASKVLY